MFDIFTNEFFQAIGSIWILLGIVAISVLVLGKGADWLVDNAAEIASDLGVGKLIIGATIVSLGTTTPEASVSVYAAWTGNASLALGNAVGSIICDTGLIFGIACLMARIPIDRKLVNRQGWIQFGSGLLLAGLCYFAWINAAENVEKIRLARWVGGGLVALLGCYLFMSFRWSKQAQSKQQTEENLRKPIKVSKFAKHAVMLVVGLTMILVSSRVLIGSVTEVAVRWSVPEAVIAASLVAFGTSLPELVTAVVGVIKGQKEIVLGNVIGADILNVLFVVGASALAAPLPIEKSFFYIHLPVMVGILAMFRVFIFVSGKSFQRWMGFPFVIVYIIYIISQYGNPIH